MYLKMIYYISDIHFRDQKIFDKCFRPFQSLEEMEREIIREPHVPRLYSYMSCFLIMFIF